MTREARLFSGIILITVPTIQYGGYFLLTSLMVKTSGYMDNQLRQNFFRAGHAHAGVIVILSTGVPGVGRLCASSCFVTVDCPNRRSTSGNPHLCRIFLFDVIAHRYPAQQRGGINLCRSSGACYRSPAAWGRTDKVRNLRVRSARSLIPLAGTGGSSRSN